MWRTLAKEKKEDDVSRELALHGRMKVWEGHVRTLIDSRMRRHWVAFDKWEDKIVQLEPGSKEGTITMAESRIRKSVQKEMEGVWRDRMERDEKVTTNI